MKIAVFRVILGEYDFIINDLFLCRRIPNDSGKIVDNQKPV